MVKKNDKNEKKMTAAKLKANKLTYIFIAILFILILVLFFKMNSLQKQSTPYLQMSSTVSQTPQKDNQIIKMESIDAKQNIDIDEKHEKVLIKEEGIYFITTVIQVGATSPTTEAGWVDVWLNLNGEQMPNSNMRSVIGSQIDTNVLVCQAVQALKQGDSLSVGFSSSDPSLGVIMIQVKNEPVIASITLTAFKLNDL